MTTHVSGSNPTSTANGISPKITLYTNHGCPWAHRAHITLKCLNLPFTEIIIPLDRPREKWYLDEINPRGLVPSIKISNGVLSDEIVTESGIVSTFLADAFPDSAFWPKSHESPTSALTRARIGFFVDAWFTKVNTKWFAIMKADGEEEEALGRELVEAVEMEIEPLLKGAAPFFGGSEVMTLAEAMTAPFVIRYQAFSDHGLMPASMGKALRALPNYSKWSEAVCAQESVTYIFDGPGNAEKMKVRIGQMKAQGK